MSNKGGLEGVVVADITTSFINGEIGKLIYGGYRIEDLAEHASFEEVVFLLWHNRLPNATELEALRAEIASGAQVPDAIIDMMRLIPADANGMAVLETGVSALAHYDADSQNLTDTDVALRKAARLTGQITTLVAAWMRLRTGKEPIQPRTDLTLAENFLYMMHGTDPDPVAARAVDVYLVLLAEHGMNASTFTTRVVTATGSDMHSAVTAGISALKGPSHGGANTEAMKLFLEIGSEANVKPWFESEVKGKGRRIMGIGHRVYKAPDPRAAILKDQAEKLAASSGNEEWFKIASQLEDLALADDFFKERRLFPNVDYYSAIVLYTLELPLDMFTPLFAMSRIAGWSAHIIGQMGGRLIRPRANYVGEMDLNWLPLDQR